MKGLLHVRFQWTTAKVSRNSIGNFSGSGSRKAPAVLGIPFVPLNIYFPGANLFPRVNVLPFKNLSRVERRSLALSFASCTTSREEHFLTNHVCTWKAWNDAKATGGTRSNKLGHVVSSRSQCQRWKQVGWYTNTSIRVESHIGEISRMEQNLYPKLKLRQLLNFQIKWDKKISCKG